jgi:hypothetical protein
MVDDANVNDQITELYLNENLTLTRSQIRSVALRMFPEQVISCCWRTITLNVNGKAETLDLPPDWRGALDMETVTSVESFIEFVRAIK